MIIEEDEQEQQNQLIVSSITIEEDGEQLAVCAVH